MVFFIRSQFRDNSFGLAFTTTLTVQPSTKRAHNADKILDQVFFAILGLINDFNASTLYGQQLLNVVGQTGLGGPYALPQSGLPWGRSTV